MRYRDKRLLHKRFLPEQEKEAALAVDATMREHFGKDVLTNFHAPTGIFLDPKNAFPPLPLSPPFSPPAPAPPSSSSSSSPSSPPSSFLLTSHIIRGITYVPEMNKYKAVIKHKNRPILLGFYTDKLEALAAIDDYTKKLLSPEGKGGMKEAPRQSKYLGVSWDRTHERWVVRLSFGGKRVLSQAFRDELEEEAARVYDIHARKYHGDGALTNFDEDGVFLDPKNRVTRFAQSPSGMGVESPPPSSSSASAAAGVVDYRGVSWSRECKMWQAQVRVCVCVYVYKYMNEKVSSVTHI